MSTASPSPSPSPTPTAPSPTPTRTTPPVGKDATDKAVNPLASLLESILASLQPIENKFGEFANLSPVIITLGSLFVSLATLNYPIFLFSLASGEAFIFQKFLSSISNIVTTSEDIKENKDIGKGSKCKSIYEGSISTKFKYLLANGLGNPFPNSPLYFLSFASAYCIQSMLFFTKECHERGSSYSTRPYLATIGTSLFLLLFSIYLMVYNCDTMMGIVMSLVVGLLIGFILCNQNFYLFGKQGVDMLFIPPIIERTGMDYICVSTK